MLTPDQEKLLSIEAGNLQNAGASMPVIIDMINNMAAQLSCDSACQKRKQEDKLRKKWIDSLNQYEKLPQTIKSNEKNYYDFAKGDSYYKNDILKPKYEKQAYNLVKDEHKYLEDTTKNFNSLVNGYCDDKKSINRLKQLEEDLVEKNEYIREKIDDYYKTTLTDERRVYYEIQEIDRLKKYTFILKVIYYILIGLYVFYGPFFRKEYYKSLKQWSRLFFYITLPYIILPIVIFLTTSQPRSNNDLNIKEDIKKTGTFTKDILYSYPSTIVSQLV